MKDDPWPLALVFDFDGLLMDTETTSLESWRHEWEQWGLTLDPSGFFVDHGGDVTEQRYAELAAAVGYRYDRVVSHARRRAYRDTLHAELDLAPGMREWLREAAEDGLRTAIASSSPREWVTGHLRHCRALDAFDVVACGDEVSSHKPAPDVYLLALARLKVQADQAVAVEDTAHGGCRQVCRSALHRHPESVRGSVAPCGGQRGAGLRPWHTPAGRAGSTVVVKVPRSAQTPADVPEMVRGLVGGPTGQLSDSAEI